MNKQKNWNTNTQEDEDGFSLNPYVIFNNDATYRNTDISKNSNDRHSATGAAAPGMIAPKDKLNTNEKYHFPSPATISRE